MILHNYKSQQLKKKQTAKRNKGRKTQTNEYALYKNLQVVAEMFLNLSRFQKLLMTS
jgi:hypothetical protein